MIPAALPEIGNEEILAVQEVLASGNLTQGIQVNEFEKEFSQVAVDGAHCIAVNSGTSALHLALLASGIGPGDEVLVPSFTFAATANSVALTGATPVFVDIEEDFFCIDPRLLESAISARTKAIMPVHLYGHPANMYKISKITEKYGLMLFEDAAQAHLASIEGKKVGTWGLTGAFSFYPTKNMTSGEGGMITTFREDIAKSTRLLRNQGQEQKYKNEIVGFNNRMTDIHAAIGRVQLKKLEKWTKKRQSNADFFTKNLRGVVVPTIMRGAIHVYHQYTIKVIDLDRDRFVEELKKLGVGSGVYYPTPNHQLPSYSIQKELPVTEEITKQVVSLPVYPSLSEPDLEKIVEAVNKIAAVGI